MENEIDFDKSFTMIAYDESCNTWRQKIISKMTITDKNGDILDEVYLNQACLAESAYGSKNMLVGEYTWQSIITKKHMKVVRIGPYKKVIQNDIVLRDSLDEISVIQNNCDYQEISEDRLYQIMESKEALNLICQTEYNIDNMVNVSILYAGNYINFNNKRRYQFDSGLVLSMLKFTENYIENIEVAYCAFSNVKERTEFNTLSNKAYQLSGNYIKIKNILNGIICKLPMANIVFFNLNNKINATNKIYVKKAPE